MFSAIIQPERGAGRSVVTVATQQLLIVKLPATQQEPAAGFTLKAAARLSKTAQSAIISPQRMAAVDMVTGEAYALTGPALLSQIHI